MYFAAMPSLVRTCLYSPQLFRGASPVKGDEDGDLRQRGQATREGVHLLRGVQLLDRLVGCLWIVGIPSLELLHLWSIQRT